MAVMSSKPNLQLENDVPTKQRAVHNSHMESHRFSEADKNRSTKDNWPPRTVLYCIRLIVLGVFLMSYIKYNSLQETVDGIWYYLCGTWVYNCVYFETWWATICYGVLLAGPYVVTKLGIFERHKIDPSLKWQSAGVIKIVLESIEYCTPLMLLDTFTVKKYDGVDPKEWEIRAEGYTQYTRALPTEPPTVFQIFWQLALSFVIYDLIFFVVHFTLHKNLWLYKTVHAAHHDHSLVHSRVTNQLTVAERIILVLSANQALKFVRGHPLTRTLFVPLFIAMLVENHCGYDLPFTLDKIVPCGIFGGSAKHHKHHTHGSRNYQPFFTYIDRSMLLYHNWSRQSKRLE